MASLEQLAQFIKEQNPDIVALQEVDCNTYREQAPKQNNKDFATELDSEPDDSAYGKRYPIKGDTME